MTMGNYIVFIQIHGEAEKLEKCWKSLAYQDFKPSKVVIVDDGTPDDSVRREYMRILNAAHLNYISVDYFKGADPKEPNLDTVGIAMKRAFGQYVLFTENQLFSFLSIIDVDSCPAKNYYRLVIEKMNLNPSIMCCSGVIKARTKCGYYRDEKLLSAKFIKRKDARGSGKVIRAFFLNNIPLNLFPEVAWDTWINVKAKQAGYKTIQLPYATIYASRSTTRVSNRDNFRDGRLSYHFGYNPLLILYKVLFRGLDVLRGYREARQQQWRLPDEKVRQWFGWRYLLHFWK